MTINPDLERELALVVERESLAVAVRMLRLLYAEVVRLDNELTQTQTAQHLMIDRITGILERSVTIDNNLNDLVAGLRFDVDRLIKLHANARPGHGYATMAGEHSTPTNYAKE